MMSWWEKVWETEKQIINLLDPKSLLLFFFFLFSHFLAAQTTKQIFLLLLFIYTSLSFSQPILISHLQESDRKRRERKREISYVLTFSRCRICNGSSLLQIVALLLGFKHQIQSERLVRHWWDFLSLSRENSVVLRLCKFLGFDFWCCGCRERGKRWQGRVAWLQRVQLGSAQSCYYWILLREHCLGARRESSQCCV